MNGGLLILYSFVQNFFEHSKNILIFVPILLNKHLVKLDKNI